MAPTDPEDPHPRTEPIATPYWQPKFVEEIALTCGVSGPDVPFSEVLDGRRSVRALRAIDLERIGCLLWHAARTRASFKGWQHRAAPSAGGLHPIEILLVMPPEQDVLVYDPIRHLLGRLAEQYRPAAVAVSQEIEAMVPDAHGALLLFAGNRGRTEATYENAVSLIWRDAGCLLAVTQIVGTWLGLGSCPVGVLGGPLVTALAPEGELVPAGAIVVGELA